ncbi:HTH-type transcriptional activator CmpR [Candidatus Entotheonellaceae bacterium PAL068K]
MRDMDLRQVEIFYHVAKFRSFSKAGEALYLTQPTISGHIKAIEESLSLVLFDRLGRQIRLTRAGEVLYGYAKRLLATKAAALEALQELQGGLRGELIIGGSSIPGQYILPALLGQFARRYPAITVNLTITDSMQTMERIVHGALELGVVGAHVPHPRVVYHQFIEDELVVAVPRLHPWAAPGTVPLTALTTQPFIQRERGSGSRLVVEQTLKLHGLDASTLHIAAEMGSTEAIKQGIRAGLGVAIISRFALTDDLRAGCLCAVTIQNIVLRRSFYIIRHKGHTLSPLCQTFEHFLYSVDPVSWLAPDTP